MKIKKHHSSRYLVNKIQAKLYEILNPKKPWLNRQAIELLEKTLKPNMTGLELGSGRSTLWFSKKISHLISLEHNKSWYDIVTNLIAKEGAQNIDYHYFQRDEDQAYMCDYVKFVEALNDDSLDFVLIDGACRSACANVSIKKVKPQGTIIIDNVNRYLPNKTYSPYSIGENGKPVSPDWEEFYNSINNWKLTWLSDGISDTAFFVKP